MIGHTSVATTSEFMVMYLFVAGRVAPETEVSVVRCSVGLLSLVSATPVLNSAPSTARLVETSPGASSETAFPANKHRTLQVSGATTF